MKEEKYRYYDENDNECEREFTELEKEFLSNTDAATKEIKTHIAEAGKALEKAVEVSEKYGIPFRSGISFLRNTYTPESYEEKFEGKIDREWASDVANTWLDGYGSGWQHSAVC